MLPEDMRRLQEAVERLERATLGEGERRGWFAPRPSGKRGVSAGGQARHEIAELEALYRLSDERG